MLFRRTLIGLALGLGCVALPALSPLAPAHAQATVLEDLLVELLPVGEVMGDGVTTVALHVLVMDKLGTPLSGVKAKLEATQGEATALTEVVPGIYRFEWIPPKVDEPTTADITVKGKTLAKDKFARGWSVPIQAPLHQLVDISISPTALTLGDDVQASISVSLTGGAKQTAKAEDLLLTTSVGELENLTRMDAGQFNAIFKPPADATPQIAVITVADRRDPNKTYGHVTVPLTARIDYPVRSKAKSKVLVQVREREFGPVDADSRGRAKVPIEVPPGENDALLVTLLGDERFEEELSLEVPISPRVRMLPTYEFVPADPYAPIPLRAVVSKSTGGPDSRARVFFTATGGEVSEARHEGNGVYSATWSPPLANAATEVSLQVSVDDKDEGHADSRTLTLIPARPKKMTLRTNPEQLTKDDTAFALGAKVAGADGVGMPGRVMAFVVNGARQDGETLDAGEGNYEAQFKTTGKGPVELMATVKAVGSNNPVRNVLVFPTRERLPNDGLSSAMLTVLALDEFGYPVKNEKVVLMVLSGDGSMPKVATTDEYGVAQVHYTAGRKAGLVRLQVACGGHLAGVGLLQLPKLAAQGLDLPSSGSVAQLDLMAAWGGVVQTVRLER